MTRRFNQALKAGSVAYAVSLLAIALFLSPIVGSHIDFGHTHAPNTVTHVHAISGFLTGITTQGISFVYLLLSFIGTVLVARSSARVSIFCRVCKSRAPPVFALL